MSWHEFLSFDDKYSGGKNGGGKRELPANIPSEIRDNVKGITKRIYEDLDMSGVVRVDFLLSDDKKLFVNEVNTVPGSMAFYLFEPVGISFRTVLDGIIAAAIIRKKKRVNRDFISTATSSATLCAAKARNTCKNRVFLIQ